MYPHDAKFSDFFLVKFGWKPTRKKLENLDYVNFWNRICRCYAMLVADLIALNNLS